MYGAEGNFQSKEGADFESGHRSKEAVRIHGGRGQ